MRALIYIQIHKHNHCGGAHFCKIYAYGVLKECRWPIDL